MSNYISHDKVNTARTLLATQRWQDSTQVAHVERAAVLGLIIDWAQGRVEAPEQVAEVMSDLHIGSGGSGYSLSTRMNLILAHLASKHEADERTAHGTVSRVLHAPVTAEGLDALIKWLLIHPERDEALPLGEVDSTLEMHPNVRKALKHAGITEREDISAVLSHSRMRSNISGGISSGWIGAAAQALKHAGGAKALREQDAEDCKRLSARERAWR